MDHDRLMPPFSVLPTAGTEKRFVVKKKEERSEVKVQEGPEGFGFYEGETYTFKYSFRAKEGMKVAKK